MAKDLIKSLVRLIVPISSGWEITDITIEDKLSEVYVELSYTDSDYKFGGNRYKIYDFRPVRKWRHLDLWQYKTYIKVQVPRIETTDGIVSIELPWADDFECITGLVQKKIIDTLLATKNQTKTAKLLSVSFDIVNRVMHKSTERELKKRSKNIIYKHISIDEKAVKKGHEYISILSDEMTGVVIGAVEGRTKKSVKSLCTAALTEHQRSKAETICTDMWDAYIHAAKKYFGNAKHCHDNFHLAGYLNKAVDKVRRREVKVHEELKHTKYIFLKDQLTLTEKQRIKFESIKGVNYEISRARQIKENFRDIQFKQTSEEAFTLFMRWRQDAVNAKIPEMTTIVEMFDRHIKGTKT